MPLWWGKRSLRGVLSRIYLLIAAGSNVVVSPWAPDLMLRSYRQIRRWVERTRVCDAVPPGTMG